MTGLYRMAAAAVMLGVLGGCVVAPPPPPAYGHAPGHYAPRYAVYPPPVSVGIGFGGGWHHWR